MSDGCFFVNCKRCGKDIYSLNHGTADRDSAVQVKGKDFNFYAYLCRDCRTILSSFLEERSFL